MRNNVASKAKRLDFLIGRDIQQIFKNSVSTEILAKPRDHRTSYLNLFWVFETFAKFRETEPKSPKSWTGIYWK